MQGNAAPWQQVCRSFCSSVYRKQDSTIGSSSGSSADSGIYLVLRFFGARNDTHPSMHLVRLRLHCPTTLAAVTQVLQASFRPDSVPHVQPQKRWWGVVVDHTLVAVASLENGVLWDVSVLPAYRKRGIATALVQYLCRQEGSMRLYLADCNLQRFYARLGFVVEAEAALPPRALLSMVRRNAAQEVPTLATNG